MPLPRKSLAKRKTIGGSVLTKVLPTIVSSDKIPASTQTLCKSVLSSEVVDADGFQFTRKKQKTLSTESSHALSVADSMAVPLNDTLMTRSMETALPLPQVRKSLAVKVVNFDTSESDRRSISSHPTAVKRMTYASSLSRRRSSVALRSYRPTLLPTTLSRDSVALSTMNMASGFTSSAPSLAAHAPVGMPHATIPTSDYYKYLSAELPGPLRLKQLFLWGFHNIMAETVSTPVSIPDSDDAIVQQILQETFDSLQTNEFSVSWYQRDATAEPSRPLKPHPKDEETRVLIGHYESIATRIENEMKEWEIMLASVKSLDAETEVMGSEHLVETFCEPLVASVLDTERELISWNKGLLEIDSWMQSFEFKVDQLQNALKMGANLERHAKSVCESTFHQIVQHVFTRRESTLPPMDPLTVLRSLSRANVDSS